jgi:predicted amidohydrolase
VTGSGGPVRVALAQVAATTDRAANASAAGAAVVAGAGRAAALVVLPEYSSAFDPAGVGPELAEPLDGLYLSTLRAAAAASGVSVLAGVTIPGEEPSRASNAVSGIDAAGRLVGVYRKVHLYDAFGARESDRLEPGPAAAAPLVIGAGRLRFGVLTCYDLRFPESARRLVDAGADVIVVPAAWAPGPGKLDHWRTLVRARAIENTTPVVAVGMCGPGGTGHSLAVGADGVVLAEAGDDPELLLVDLDPADIARVRAANPSLANRRYAVVPR